MKVLTRIKPELYYYKNGRRIEGVHDNLKGDVTGLWGDVTDLRGDVTNLSGDVTGLSGDVTGLYGDATNLWGDLNEISVRAREENPDINFYVKQL